MNFLNAPPMQGHLHDYYSGNIIPELQTI